MTIDPAALSRIASAVARPADAAAAARRAYVTDRKRVQATLTRAIVALGLPYESASRLAVAVLRASARNAVNSNPDLEARLNARALAKVEERGREATAILMAANAYEVLEPAVRSVMADARLSAGAREVARLALEVVT